MRGFWVTVAREIPAYAGFYAGFESTKRAFQKWKFGYDHRPRHNHRPAPPLPVWALLTSGAVGGIGYWTFCYPLGAYGSFAKFAASLFVVLEADSVSSWNCQT